MTLKKALGIVTAAAVILVSMVSLAACSSSNDEAVALLEDPKVGLTHLNEELHTVKGEALLASPSIGLAHLNDELHLLKDPKVGLTHLNDEIHLLKDPKVGLEHLNAEIHAVKELLAELSQQVASLQEGAQ